MNEHLPVSVIISTYNWPEALAMSVRSVFTQTILPRQIIIADDGSGDATRQCIQQLQRETPQGVELLHAWHKDQGFRAAAIRNKAIAKVKTPYIIQIDGDCVMERHFIHDHLSLVKKGHFIAGSRVMLSPSHTQAILASKDFKFKKRDIAFGHILNTMRMGWLRALMADQYKKNNIWAARGANMSFFLQDIEAVNGYNETFVGWGFEDSELAFRLYNSGIRHRTLKFGGILYHLYHNKRDQQKADFYRQLALQVYESGATRTEVGLQDCEKRS